MEREPVGCVLESDLKQAVVALSSPEKTGIPIEVGDYIIILKEEKNEYVILEIENLKRVPGEVAKEDYPIIDTLCAQVVSEYGLLISKSKIIGVSSEGKLKELGFPLFIGERVYIPSEKELEPIFSSSGDGVIFGKIKIGYTYNEDGGVPSKLYIDLKFDPSRLDNRNVLVLSENIEDSSRIIGKLVSNLSKRDDISIVIVDPIGNLVKTFKDKTLAHQKRYVSMDTLVMLMTNGFGYEYMEKNEVVKALTSKVGYNIAPKIEKIFSDESLSYPLSIEKIIKKAQEVNLPEGFQKIIQNIWKNNAGLLLEKNTVNIIDISQGYLKNQVQVVYRLLKGILDELSRRRSRGDATTYYFVINGCERFIPVNELVSDEIQESCSDIILNTILKTDLLNYGFICVSSTPSLLNRRVFHTTKDVFITKFYDEIEVETIRKFMKITEFELLSLDDQEVIIKGVLSPIKQKIIVNIGGMDNE